MLELEDVNGMYQCPVCLEWFPYDSGEHLVGYEWVCDWCFEDGRENGDILCEEYEGGAEYYWESEV